MREVWQDEAESGKWHDYCQESVRAKKIVILLVVAQAADDQHQPDHPVHHDHDHREHGIPGERRVAVTARHDGRNHGDLDADHRQRE